MTTFKGRLETLERQQRHTAKPALVIVQGVAGYMPSKEEIAAAQADGRLVLEASFVEGAASRA